MPVHVKDGRVGQTCMRISTSDFQTTSSVHGNYDRSKDKSAVMQCRDAVMGGSNIQIYFNNVWLVLFHSTKLLTSIKSATEPIEMGIK